MCYFMNIYESNYYKACNYEGNKWELTEWKPTPRESKNIYKFSLMTLQSIHQLLEGTGEIKIENNIIHLKQENEVQKLTSIAKEIVSTYKKEHQDGAITSFFKRVFGFKGKAERLEELSQKIQVTLEEVKQFTQEEAKQFGFNPDKFIEHRSFYIFLNDLKKELESLRNDPKLQHFVQKKVVEKKDLFITEKTNQIDRQETLKLLKNLTLEELNDLLLNSSERPCINSCLLKLVEEKELELNLNVDEAKNTSHTLDNLLDKAARSGRTKAIELFLILGQDTQLPLKIRKNIASLNILSSLFAIPSDNWKYFLKLTIPFIEKGAKLTPEAIRSLVSNEKLLPIDRNEIFFKSLKAVFINDKMTPEEKKALSQSLKEYEIPTGYGDYSYKLNSLLYSFSKEGNHSLLEFILDTMPESLDAKNSYSMLKGAIEKGQIEMIKFVFEKGTSPFYIFKNESLLECARFIENRGKNNSIPSTLMQDLILAEMKKQIVNLYKSPDNPAPQDIKETIKLALEKGRPDIAEYIRYKGLDHLFVQ